MSASTMMDGARRTAHRSERMLILFLVLFPFLALAGRPPVVSQTEVTLKPQYGSKSGPPAPVRHVDGTVVARHVGDFHVGQETANTDARWEQVVTSFHQLRNHARSANSKQTPVQDLGIPMARTLIEARKGGGRNRDGNKLGELCPASLAISKCVAPGESCGYGSVSLGGFSKVCNVSTTNGDPQLICEFCSPDYVCDPGSRTCQPDFAVGGKTCANSPAPCEEARFARTGFERPFACYTLPNGGYCGFAERRYLPGDFCDNNDECLNIGQDEWECRPDVQGGPARCTTDERKPQCSEYCYGSQWCNPNKNECEDKFTVGQPSISSAKCKYGAVSNGLECVKAFSIPNGGDCSADMESQIFGCAEDLMCISGQCTNGNLGAINEPCDPTLAPCPVGYTCECNAVDSTKVCKPNIPPANLCQRQWEDLFSCATVHDCHLGHDSAFEGTCVARRCASQYSCVQDCIQSRYSPSPNRVKNCAISQTLDALCLSSVFTAGPPAIPQTITSDIFITTGLDFDPDNDAAGALPSIWA